MGTNAKIWIFIVWILDPILNCIHLFPHIATRYSLLFRGKFSTPVWQVCRSLNCREKARENQNKEEILFRLMKNDYFFFTKKLTIMKTTGGATMKTEIVAEVVFAGFSGLLTTFIFVAFRNSDSPGFWFIADQVIQRISSFLKGEIICFF